MPEFNNRENKKTKTEDGRIIFLSRSCAVAVTVLFREEDVLKVLLVKRVDNMDTEPGRWCLPCGYLDYDESLYEAAVREVFEETGVYISELSTCITVGKDNNIHQPWMVHSEPEEDILQNVTNHFGFCIIDSKRPKLKLQSGEIQEIDFISIEELNKYDIAFNHVQRIFQFIHLLEEKGVATVEKIV